MGAGYAMGNNKPSLTPTIKLCNHRRGYCDRGHVYMTTENPRNVGPGCEINVNALAFSGTDLIFEIMVRWK